MNEIQNTPELRFGGFTEPWKQRELGQLFDYEQPGPYIVESTEYNNFYPTPVLTAGKTFILGYADESFGVKSASPDNPVIIFDDFTTASHYVDFPFKVKSSAIKLLTLKNSDDDITVASNALQMLAYIPVGHERHWISEFAGFNVFIPDSSVEQQFIGTFFRNLDSLIALQQRKYERLQHLKQALLRKMFPKPGEQVPELRFDGFTEPWEERKFGEEFLFLRNNTLSRAELCDADGDVLDVHYGDVLIKYSSVIDITKANLPRIIDARKVSGCDSLHNGDVVIADTAEDETAGKCTELRGIDNERVFSGLHTIPCRPRRIYAPGFLGHYLNSRAFRKQLFSMMQGTKVVSISKTSMASTCLTVPSIAEQITISETLSSIDSLIDLYRRKYERLLRLKQALLRKMFV